jgi:putative two-component system hydrogenase maturation factor HypX/HoxX
MLNNQRAPMKILLLVSSFNRQVKAVFTKLEEYGHTVAVTFTITEQQALEEIEIFSPKMILSPFLNTDLPASIYNNYPTFQFHFGPRGDRGNFPLEHALLDKNRRWGLTIQKVDQSYLCGDIYAEVSFTVRETSKASLFAHEIVDASLKALALFFKNLNNNNHVVQSETKIHDEIGFRTRAINWLKDDTQTIINKINLSDPEPGTPDELFGELYFFYGVHREERLKGEPKEILAKRDGAICLGTRDGAVWISHIKPIDGIKLPATEILGDKINTIKDAPIPLLFAKDYETFSEIRVMIKEDVAYLYFDFYDGMMSIQQCQKLQSAIEGLKNKCNVLVLMGGENDFSNGLDLNSIEHAANPDDHALKNMLTIYGLISTILYTEDITTIASLSNNAMFEGTAIALACDYIVSKKNVILNPHLQTLGYSTGAYLSYTLPRRIGEEKTSQLLDSCLPLSSQRSKKMNILDKVIDTSNYTKELHDYALSSFTQTYIEQKKRHLQKHRTFIEKCKENELKILQNELYDERSIFHDLRKNLVYHLKPIQTPEYLKKLLYN